MRASERGNAVVLILLTVALFAGLAYTFMRGAKSGQGNLSAGQAKLQAQDLINYGSTLEKGVNKLMMRGCSETELNFENTTYAGFINPAAPNDDSCNLFAAGGANLTADINVNIPGATWMVTGDQDIWGLNESTKFLIFLYGPISSQTCTAINTQVGNQYPVTYTMTATPFTGTFGFIASTGNATYGKQVGCAESSTGEFSLYSVLLERQ